MIPRLLARASGKVDLPFTKSGKSVWVAQVSGGNQFGFEHNFEVSIRGLMGKTSKFEMQFGAQERELCWRCKCGVVGIERESKALRLDELLGGRECSVLEGRRQLTKEEGVVNVFNATERSIKGQELIDPHQSLGYSPIFPV